MFTFIFFCNLKNCNLCFISIGNRLFIEAYFYIFILMGNINTLPNRPKRRYTPAKISNNVGTRSKTMFSVK